MSRIMGFIFQTLLLVVFVGNHAIAAQEGIQQSQTFGGPHGNQYSDRGSVSAGQTVDSITISTGDRVDGVGINLISPSGTQTTLYHGGRGGNAKNLRMQHGEYVNAVEVHWGQQNGRTRIKFIQFRTNKNRSIWGGTGTNNVGKATAPQGYQLGGFVGSAGNELDSVGFIWTRIAPGSINDPGTPPPRDTWD